MKKLTAMLLGLALLCCAALAGAEEAAELPYLETESQDVYISDTVLTEASYPQVCISPYSAYDLFAWDKVEPWYVTFPVPEGMSCESFRVDEANFLMLPTTLDSYPQAASAFTAELEARGGIDLLVLGLGENGHLGFNQPGTPFGSTAWVAEVSPELDARVRRELGLDPGLPLGGATLGLQDVMHARRLILAAKGTHKAAIVRQMLQGPVTEAVPASILRMHPACEFLLDADAASLL